ncbi:hypothetical protein ACTFIU_010084 [Dictyostelium citrinum]
MDQQQQQQKDIIIFQNDQLLNLLTDKFFNIEKNQPNIYYKFQNVEAVQCGINKVGSIIETVTSDGLETMNKIKNHDDFIIKNQTNANEQYIIPFNKFNDKYELFNIDQINNNSNNNSNNNNYNNNSSNNNNNKWILYKPKNNEHNKIKAIKVNKEILNFLEINNNNNNNNSNQNSNSNNNTLYEFYLIASWGEKMIFKENDYLAIPLVKNNEIYRISNKEFNETYRII